MSDANENKLFLYWSPAWIIYQFVFAVIVYGCCCSLILLPGLESLAPSHD